jgi:hypothetical protein
MLQRLGGAAGADQHPQAVHRGGKQIGVAAEEIGIGFGEGAWCGAVDLQEAVGRLAVPAKDNDVDQGADAGRAEEIGVGEALLALDILRDHRLAGFHGIAFGTRFVGSDSHVADNALRPADAGTDQQRYAVGLEFHDLGEAGVAGLADQEAGLMENVVEIVGAEGELAEFRQHRLLPQKFCLPIGRHGANDPACSDAGTARILARGLQGKARGSAPLLPRLLKKMPVQGGFALVGVWGQSPLPYSPRLTTEPRGAYTPGLHCRERGRAFGARARHERVAYRCNMP